MSRHNFPKQSIPYDKLYAEEICINCGLKSRRYTTGGRTYINEEGKVVSKVPLCRLITHTPVPAYTIDKAENKVRELNTMKYDLTQPEAIVKDLVVILILCYEEMVEKNINSRVTQMARNLLESHGFCQLVREIDAKVKPVNEPVYESV